MTVLAAMGKVTSVPRKALAALTLRRGSPTFFLKFTAVFAAVALVLALATASTLGRYLSDSVRDQTVDDVTMRVDENVAPRVVAKVTPEQSLTPFTGEELAGFDAFAREAILGAQTVRLVVWNNDGQIVYAEDQSLIGKAVPLNDDLQAALAGKTIARVEKPHDPDQSGLSSYDRLLETYVPIRQEGSSSILGAVEIYQNYASTAAHIADMQRSVYIGIAVAMGSLYLVLLLIVRRGSQLIHRQNSGLEARADELRNSYESIVAVLCSALDLRDNVTHGHAKRVSEMASVVAWQLGMRKEEVRQMEKAAILHDIGKIGVADAILSKPGPLDEAEWTEMKRHPELGYHIIQGIDFLKDAADVVYAHHERWDGTGYPRALRGEQIPPGARIFAVVDAYDAMTSHRPYRRAMSHRYAVQEILRHAGTQFDPEVVRAFVDAERRGLFDGGRRREPDEPWPAETPAATPS